MNRSRSWINAPVQISGDLRSLAHTWCAADALTTASNAALALVVVIFASRVANASAYLMLQVALAASPHLLARRASSGSPHSKLWTVLHDFSPLLIFVTIYFELDFLIPQLHALDDLRYDRLLQSIDVWLLGDPAAFVARFAVAPLSDLLTVCYWSYYVFPLVVPVVLYVRGSRDAFRRVVTITLLGYVLCFLGYLLVPAFGPHRVFDGPRAAALDGYGLARAAYQALFSVQAEPPDAFPSGHALVGILVPALALRWCRPLFVWLLPIGVGMFLATVYLRYHYLTDVLAALLLAPLVWHLGSALDRAFPALGGTRVAALVSAHSDRT